VKAGGCGAGVFAAEEATRAGGCVAFFVGGGRADIFAWAECALVIDTVVV